MMTVETESFTEQQDKADLRMYPHTINERPDRTVTFGDMHANTMKLIWLLIKEGIIELDEASFHSMWKIYDRMWVVNAEQNYTSESLETTRKDLATFRGLLGKIRVKQPPSDVRLLGDIFADRGANDYLTLKLLEQLGIQGLRPEIIFSNHDACLLEVSKKPIGRKPSKLYTAVNPNPWVYANYNNQENSLVGLYTYIELGLIDREEVISLVETQVAPSINLISYSLSADGKKIDLFMHAPNGFALIEEMARALKLPAPKSAVELAQVIDAINLEFRKLQRNRASYENVLAAIAKFNPPTRGGFLVTKEFLNDLNILDSDGRVINFATDEEAHMVSLLCMLAWNRNNTIATWNSYPDYVSHIVHGHDGGGKTIDVREVNLDDIFGKAKSYCQGIYRSFSTIGRKLRPQLSAAPQPAASQLATSTTAQSQPPIAPQPAASVAPQPPVAPQPASFAIPQPPARSTASLEKNEEYFQALNSGIREIIREVAPVIHAKGHGWGTTLAAASRSAGRFITWQASAKMSSTEIVIEAVNRAYRSSNWSDLANNLKLLGIKEEGVKNIINRIQAEKYGYIMEEETVEDDLDDSGFVLLREKARPR